MSWKIATSQTERAGVAGGRRQHQAVACRLSRCYRCRTASIRRWTHRKWRTSSAGSIRVTICGESAALETTEIDAVAVPALCGANTTFTWHEAPAAKVALHVFVSVKLDASVLVTEITTPVTSTWLGFCSVMACAGYRQRVVVLPRSRATAGQPRSRVRPSRLATAFPRSVVSIGSR